MPGMLVPCLLAGGLLLQSVLPPPQRDARPQGAASDSAVIAGRVVAADTGLPIRRAVVQLVGAAPRSRSTQTDASGHFTFSALPAGRYTVTVQPGPTRAAYLSAAFGVPLLETRGPAPSQRPKPIDLADGQHVRDLEIRLPRAAAISGRVFDASGEPVARVSVSAVAIRRGMPPMNGPRVSTNDLGEFRLFGLAPGDYVISAESSGSLFSGAGDFEGEPTGFGLTYAPGTPSLDRAQRVRLARGAHAAIDIQLTDARLFSISGTVLNTAGDAPSGAAISVMRADQIQSFTLSANVSPTGAFTVRHVPPGIYDVLARHTTTRTEDPSGKTTRTLEQGIVRVEVANAAVDGVTLVTSRGETVTGEIVFDDAVTAERFVSLRVQQPDPLPMFSLPTVEVKGTTFTLHQLFGPILLRGNASGPSADGFALKAVLLDGKDITDQPTVLTGAHSGRLQVLFTSRAATLEGSVTDESGKLVEDCVVLVFGEEPESWVPHSLSFRTLRPATDGKYSLRAVREGNYRIVALPGDVSVQVVSPDVEWLETLKKHATAVRLNPGETRTVDLRVVRIDQ